MPALSAQFAARSIGRAYRALTWGAPVPANGKIEGNIGRHKTHRKKMAVVTRGGKPALTRYKTIHTYMAEALPLAAMLDVELATGRTHQIRVHLAHLGYPIIGDSVYGRSRRARRTRPGYRKFGREFVPDQ